MMNRSFYLGALTTIILLAGSAKSWGSATLPQPCYGDMRVQHQVFADTVPAKAAPVQPQQPGQTTPEAVVQPVVKQVPKSRKKLKPAAVTPKVNVPPTKIIKPKIVIKKINVNVP